MSGEYITGPKVMSTVADRDVASTLRRTAWSDNRGRTAAAQPIFWPLNKVLGIVPGMADLTAILEDMNRGVPNSADRLLASVYEELRRVAAGKLAAERPGQTLDATALVHEAYLRMTGQPQQWRGRRHFFAAAAESMRRILVESARRKRAEKRGGRDIRRAEWSANFIPDQNTAVDLFELHDILDRFSQVDPDAAELVKLRHFVGMTLGEAAEALEIPSRTADRLWALAKAWLWRELRGDTANDR